MIRFGTSTLSPPAPAREPVKPFLKWVGGKRRLLPELAARMPVKYDRYFEPFLGGGALFFHERPENALLSDVNEDLINTYRGVQQSSDAVLDRLKIYQAWHSATYYKGLQEAWNTGRLSAPLDRAAAFIYLNKTCFNGLWRVNRAGKHNVPIGAYKNPNIADSEAILAASSALKTASVTVSDYMTSVLFTGKGDFVYFDPPYVPVSPTAKFTTYSAGGFGLAEQEKLAVCASALALMGVKVMLSNSNAPLVRELYKDFRIDEVRVGRTVNSDPTARGDVTEVIICSDYVQRREVASFPISSLY